jgi:hypothetical protein
MAYFWAIVKAIPAIVTIFSKIEEYVIKPSPLRRALTQGVKNGNNNKTNNF